MAKLKKPLIFSTYRDRSEVYGHGSSSGNEPCEITSINEDLLRPDLCLVCGTTRSDPLLPYVGNSLGQGRALYREHCTREQDFETYGRTLGFQSRSTALYGLYLEKVSLFFDMHTDHVMYATYELREDLQFLMYSPLVLHINFWGIDLGYPDNIQNIANQLMSIKDQQLAQGIHYAVKDWTDTQKNLHSLIVEFLEKQPNWNVRYEAWEEYKDRSNHIGTQQIEVLLPKEQDIELTDDQNLDDFFDPNDTDIPF